MAAETWAGVWSSQNFWNARSTRVGCAPASTRPPAPTATSPTITARDASERAPMTRQYTARPRPREQLGERLLSDVCSSRPPTVIKAVMHPELQEAIDLHEA